MNTETLLFTLIVGFIIFDFVLSRFLDYLNVKNYSATVPEAAKEYYEAEKYKKSQLYSKDKLKLSLISSSISFVLILALLFTDGFALLDNFARSYSSSSLWQLVIFFGVLGIASDIIGIPFSIYGIFVIEEKYGFNKTSPFRFITDKVKSWLLSIAIGLPLIALILWIYESSGSYFWLLVWAVITLFSVFMNMFYSNLIVPLFNKQTPLEEGELRTAIEKFALKADFKLQNIYVIDGSKRSTKANAYFAGLGPKKRIVLYDTLIEQHSIEELVAVLAHEIGHYKKKHTVKNLVMSVAQTGIILFIFSLLVDNPAMSSALGASESSFHIGIIAFALIFSPINMILGIFSSVISRKYEYQADKFAAEKYDAEELSKALLILSANNLSNLTPHPTYVFFYYSHPPVLDRIKAMKENA
jgi:STE24 endopeptidase